MTVEISQTDFWNKSFEENFASWLNNLDSKESEAVYMYMYHWHKDMNNSVRDNTPTELAISLSSALEKASKLGNVFFRGSSRIPEVTIGDSIVYDSFISTSVNPHTAAKFMRNDKVFYKIETTSGGVPLSSDMNEEEMLLNYGSEFIVVDIVKDTTVKIFYPETDYCVAHDNVTYVHLLQK